MKELLEKSTEDLVDWTRNVYSLGADVYNFFADKMGLMIEIFYNLAM